MLYQLSYEPTHLGAGQIVGLMCSRERTNLVNEMNVFIFEVRIIDEGVISDSSPYVDNLSHKLLSLIDT